MIIHGANRFAGAREARVDRSLEFQVFVVAAGFGVLLFACMIAKTCSRRKPCFMKLVHSLLFDAAHVEGETTPTDADLVV